MRAGDGFHTLLHNTDVLKDTGYEDEDPARHLADADHERRHKSDCSERSTLPAPEPQSEASCGGNEQPVQAEQHARHQCGEADIATMLRRLLLERGSRVDILPL